MVKLELAARQEHSEGQGLDELPREKFVWPLVEPEQELEEEVLVRVQ